MTNNASDNEQVMSVDEPATDSEDEVLIKKSPMKSKPNVENNDDDNDDDDDTSDDEVLALKPDRKSVDTTDDKSKQTVNKMLQLPVSRIKTIMKSSPELAMVKPEAYVLITRATELFVQYLAQKAHAAVPGQKRTLEYSALSSVVSKDESLDFLEEIVPFKIKMKDYWERYGYPKKPDDYIEVIEIDSNGSSTSSTTNGHASSASTTTTTTPKPKTPVQKTTPGQKTPVVQKQPQKTGTTTLHNSASKTIPKQMNAKPTKLTPAAKTPTPGKTQKTIDSMVKPVKPVTPKNTNMVNGHTTKTVNGSAGKSLSEVICIDD